MKNQRREMARRLSDPDFTGSLDPPEPPEPPVAETGIALARSIVAKSRSRVKWLTIATCLAWITATAAGIAATFCCVSIRYEMQFDEYRLAKAFDIFEQKRAAIEPTAVGSHKTVEDLLSPEEYEQFSTGARVVGQSTQRMLILLAATFLLFGTAALLSVWLITASRRCTMKQINANLASLALDLKAIANEPVSYAEA